MELTDYCRHIFVQANNVILLLMNRIDSCFLKIGPREGANKNPFCFKLSTSYTMIPI